MYRTMKQLLILMAPMIIVCAAERCPPIFGAYECPTNYKCINSTCVSADTKQLASEDCNLVSCPPNSRCYKGRCYEAKGLPCDRNVITTKLSAKSISSDCGQNGKCLNGRCVEDSTHSHYDLMISLNIKECVGVSCKEDELCRDGKCEGMSNKFCLTDFDCGPNLDCVSNKCVYFRKGLQCNCDPEETCKNGQCIPNPKCAQISCEEGMRCSDGVCVSAIGDDCAEQPCPRGTVCVRGKCALDQCRSNQCPVDHACRRGQCRHLQGMLCESECPSPYECINGLCTRNECALKVCQIGETCENGFCFRIEGRFCTSAVRDCAAEFECQSNQCRDKLTL
uniref:Tenascin-X n=1 Tax=Syphacia muris TaxID=451379 RepID=A0A0N5AIG1_9BILA